MKSLMLIAGFQIVRDWGESGLLRTTKNKHGGKEGQLALELLLCIL